MTSETDWEQILAESMEDWRLSRGEKQVLRELLADLQDNPHALAKIRSIAFRLAEQAIVDPTAHAVFEWLEQVIKAVEYRPPGSEPQPTGRIAESWFSPDPACVERIIRQFHQARQLIRICVFTITDNRISDTILDTHMRRIPIQIITDNDKANDAGSDVARLHRAGVSVKVDQVQAHMHHKYALFDDEILLTGSYNWTRSAARENQENFIITDDPRLVVEFKSHFQKLWKSLPEGI